MYCENDCYRGLGYALPQSAWSLARAGRRTTTEHTDKGVIIRPVAQPDESVDPIESKPVVLPPPPPVRPRPETVIDVPAIDVQPPPVVSTNGAVPPPELRTQLYTPDVTFLPLEGGGGGPGTTDVQVTVEAPPGLTPAEDRKGFGMVEVAIGAGLAALLASALQRRRR